MPYCPRCATQSPPGAGRCGLDGAVLRLWSCCQCHREVSPNDRFCGHCGASREVPGWPSRPVKMEVASRGRRVGALIFDFLLSWTALQVVLPEQPLVGAVVALPLWVALLESQQLSSPGQQIFALQRLAQDGSPLSRASWRASKLFWVPR